MSPDLYRNFFKFVLLPWSCSSILNKTASFIAPVFIRPALTRIIISRTDYESNISHYCILKTNFIFEYSMFSVAFMLITEFFPYENIQASSRVILVPNFFFVSKSGRQVLEMFEFVISCYWFILYKIQRNKKEWFTLARKRTWKHEDFESPNGIYSSLKFKTGTSGLESNAQ